MRQRMKAKATYANVMVTALAFLMLGGGTALASYVVSSNSQIGPGTISGHKPPAGDHANVIAKSITSQDLAKGAAGKVNEAEVNGGDIRTTKISISPADGFAEVMARKVDYEQPGRGFFLGTVRVTNPSPSAAAEVQVRATENGKPEPGISSATIGPGDSDTIPISFVCNAMPQGSAAMGLEVRTVGGGVNVMDRNETVMEFRPIFHPPT
jgi:hypothetical protein